MSAPCPIFCLWYLNNLRIRNNKVFSLIQYLNSFQLLIPPSFPLIRHLSQIDTISVASDHEEVGGFSIEYELHFQFWNATYH